MRSKMTTSVFALFLATTISAQSFNVDIGGLTPGGAGGGNPAPVHGAAAHRPGIWNPVSGIGTGPFPLVDLHGHATAAVVTRDDGIGGLYGFNNSQTTGYFQSLMDDAHSIGAPGTTHSYTITGLLPGNYTVFTYAWSPQSAAYLTSVTVLGATSANPQIVGGALPALNTYALGTTHCIHQVTVLSGGNLVISATAAAGFAFLNGFQIVDGWGLSVTQPVPNGFLQISNSFGTPGNAYVNLFTVNAGAFPNGPLFGLDMTIPEAINQVLMGPPFYGTLNSLGESSYTISGIIPSGITLYCVGIETDPGLATILNVTAPFSYTTL